MFSFLLARTVQYCIMIVVVALSIEGLVFRNEPWDSFSNQCSWDEQVFGQVERVFCVLPDLVGHPHPRVRVGQDPDKIFGCDVASDVQVILGVRRPFKKYLGSFFKEWPGQGPQEGEPGIFRFR